MLVVILAKLVYCQYQVELDRVKLVFLKNNLRKKNTKRLASKI